MVILNKLYGFFEKKNDFVEIAKIKDFFWGCNWNFSKTSQNVQKLVLINKINKFSEKKLWFFWKIAEASKFTVKCNWIIKKSQNFKKLGFLIKKIDGFFEKLVKFF